MARQVAGHGVHRVRQILPGSGDARYVGLSTQSALRTHFAGHAGNFASKAIQLIDHGVEGFFQLQNFAAHVDGDFARQIAAGDGRGDFGYITHLAGEVAGHEVHVVGKIFPRTTHPWDLRLAAQLAFGTDFASHTRNFAGEGVELVHHGVDGVFQFEDFAFYVNRDFAG